ncbi:MAG: M4 family metallopeptidase, partial [Ilumatobacteraceae bacterium]
MTIGASVLIVATTLSWSSGPAAAIATTPQSLTAELQRASGDRTQVSVRPQTGVATFVGGSGGHPLAPAVKATAEVAARGFVDHYGALFGVADPSTDLTELRTFRASSGNSAVRFQQTYRGVPVLAGELAVQVAADGSVQSTSGEALPDLNVDVTARVASSAAADLARSLTSKYDEVDVGLLTASAPELMIYDPSLLGADGPAGSRLVWHVDVRTALGDADRFVLIDAHTGDVALHFSQRDDARNRSVCSDGNSSNSEQCTTPVRIESDVSPYAGPGAVDVNGAFDLSGVTYDFYSSRFGRDSVDGAGLPLKSTVLYCPTTNPSDCPYKGAFWNGFQMVYGQGYATADDVVGHELTHGVTQYTSRLLYYAESGAINESMSDVMGELIDLSYASTFDTPADRWQLGEGIPGGAIRSMSNPPAHNDPDRMTSALYAGGPGDSHGVHRNSGVNNKAAFLITDGGSFNGQTIVGLGEVKAAQIYYAAETTLLGPGSDYLDLFHILPQACTNLVGTHGIVSADCAEVVKAVTATEMDKFPTTPGAHLAAPICDGTAVQEKVLLSDNMEVNNGNWTTSASAAGSGFGYFTGSSQSGVKSLHA